MLRAWERKEEIEDRRKTRMEDRERKYRRRQNRTMRWDGKQAFADFERT